MGAAAAAVGQHLLEFMPGIMKMILRTVSVLLNLLLCNKLHQILAA